MQEHTPFQDEETNYTPEDDLIADTNQEGFGEKNVDNLIDEEIIEPDLMYECRDDSEAALLLKKCAKWANSSSWTSNKPYEGNWTNLKKYLTEIENEKTEGKINMKQFIKYFYLGICEFRLKNYKEALDSFLQANKSFKYYQLNYNIALCYMKLNELENAVFYLEDVTKKNKNFFFAYYNLIKIYLKKNNTNDAFLIYREFSEIIKKEKDKEKLSQETGITSQNRMSVTSFNTLKLFYKIGAECLFAKKLYQECVYTILDALKFNPEDAELWFLYAKVFVMKKSFEFAVPLLQKAIDLEPDFPEAKKLLQFLQENIN